MTHTNYKLGPVRTKPMDGRDLWSEASATGP